jgi:hypothetical protein
MVPLLRAVAVPHLRIWGSEGIQGEEWLLRCRCLLCPISCFTSHLVYHLLGVCCKLPRVLRSSFRQSGEISFKRSYKRSLLGGVTQGRNMVDAHVGVPVRWPYTMQP